MLKVSGYKINMQKSVVYTSNKELENIKYHWRTSKTENKNKKYYKEHENLYAVNHKTLLKKINGEKCMFISQNIFRISNSPKLIIRFNAILFKIQVVTF